MIGGGQGNASENNGAKISNSKAKIMGAGKMSRRWTLGQLWGALSTVDFNIYSEYAHIYKYHSLKIEFSKNQMDATNPVAATNKANLI